jgi:hypothetical protein
MGLNAKSRVLLSNSAVRANSRWIYTSNAKWDPVAKIPRALYNIHYGPIAGSPEDIARKYLSYNTRLFKINNITSELKTTLVQQSPAGHHVRFEQLFNGIPVYQSDVVVSISKTNYVTFLSNNYRPNLQVQSLNPLIDTSTAIVSAINYLNVRGEIIHREGPELFVFADSDPARLCYRTVISASNPHGAWELLTDAVTGEIFSQRNIEINDKPQRNNNVASGVNGTGYIYNPDPLTTALKYYGAGGFTDNNHADSPQLTAQRQLTVLKDITFSNGSYTLSGPYVRIQDWDLPNIGVVTATDPDSFRYTRSQAGFADVNVYFHIDSTQRYIQSLGFYNIQNGQMIADPQGQNGDDNSSYNPSLNAISYGTGGVPDAEDADVILHEYGHAIQAGTVPGWGGGEEGALGEGFGDYWAGSYSRAVNPTFSRNFIFTWDAGLTSAGTGAVWDGRILNDTRNYPDTGVAGGESHNEGQLWSSVLMSFWDDLGRSTMDPIVLLSHYYMGTGGTMRDNAQAILQADRDMNYGEHLTLLTNRFIERNFLARPKLVSQPLTDTENMDGPFIIQMDIQEGYLPLDLTRSYVLWSRDSLLTDTAYIQQTNNAGLYLATIPGNGLPATYRYQIFVRDSIGTEVALPANAASGSYYSFFAGRDTVSPVISITPLVNQSLFRLPITLKAIASDNLGVGYIHVDYYRQRGNIAGSFSLTNTDGANYAGSFPFTSSDLVGGDSVFYKITISDTASIPNVVTIPSSNYWSFAFSKGNLLIVNNDVASSTHIQSPSLFYRVLAPMGYSIDTTDFLYFGSTPLSSYDIIIWSAGVTTAPIASAGKREVLTSWVKQGGRLWMESGSAGWFYRPDGPNGGQTNFRQYVLHDSTWIDDAADANLVFNQPVNKIFTAPYLLSQPIGFTTVAGAADRDAVLINPDDAGATQLAAWSTESTAGSIISYTPPGGKTAQTLYFAFALSAITDTTVAKNLIENSINAFSESTPMGVKERPVPLPTAYNLSQNYPNPFNPSTQIRFDLPERSHVRLQIYNILGQEMHTLVNEDRNPGSYVVEFNAAGLPSGVYFYKITAGNYTAQRKMLIIK